MSPREQRLRERIDQLLDERDVLRRRRDRPQPKRVRTRRCVYCGARTNTTRFIAACPSHRDLIEVDAHYGAAA